MKTLLLLVLLSTHPLAWDGTLWVALPPETKLAWVAGFESGLAVAAYLKHDPFLVIPPSVEASYIVSQIDIFYVSEANRSVSIVRAILYVGKGVQ